MQIVQYLSDHWAVIASVGWGLCEALAQIPAIKANSIFGLIQGLFKKPAA